MRLVWGLGLTLLASFVILGAGLGASGGLARIGAWAELCTAKTHTLTSEYFGNWGQTPLEYYLVYMIAGVFGGAADFRHGGESFHRATRTGQRLFSGKTSRAGSCRRHFGGICQPTGKRLYQRTSPDRRRPFNDGQLGVSYLYFCRGLCCGAVCQEAME